MFCNQGISGLGETSRELGVVAEYLILVLAAPMRAKLMILNFCLIAELPTLILVASHLDREVVRQIGDDPRNTVDLNIPRQLEVMGKGLNSAVSMP